MKINIDLTPDEIRESLLSFLDYEKRKMQTLKQAKQSEALIEAYPDIAEEMIRENYGKWEDEWDRGVTYTRKELYKKGRCHDLALLDAKSCVDLMEFTDDPEIQQRNWGYTWTNDDVEALKSWLLCETDVIPDPMPINHYWQGVGIAPLWRLELISSTAAACEFPARFCVFSFCKGEWHDYFKEMLRGVLINYGIDYAQHFMDDIQQNYMYQLEQRNPKFKDTIMAFYALVYAHGDRMKIENEFYGKWIDKWLAEDKEHFFELIRNMQAPDLRKKCMKKYIGSTK